MNYEYVHVFLKKTNKFDRESGSICRYPVRCTAYSNPYGVHVVVYSSTIRLSDYQMAYGNQSVPICRFTRIGRYRDYVKIVKPLH